MRPVNLIPPEERRDGRAAARTGAVPYVLVGVLAAALVAVTAIALTGKQISERQTTVLELEAREATVSAGAEALRPYTEFFELASARQATVTSLAQSRFDWERVLRELALVIPDDVWLTEVVGSAGADAQASGGAAVGDETITGPALSFIGCGADMGAVAGFVSALKDIDGVTRVGISSSERADSGASAATGDSATGGGADCRTTDMIAKFEIIAAFDGVPTTAAVDTTTAPVDTTTAPVAPPPAPAAPVEDGSAEQRQSAETTGEQIEGTEQATAETTGREQ